MIPTPRPGPRFGDCPDCGRAHDGECHLAEMERNREVPDGSGAVIWAMGKPIPCETPAGGESSRIAWSPATITYGREEGGVVTPPPRLFDEALAHVLEKRAALFERLAKGPGGQE